MKNLITPLLMATALIATACTNTNDIDTPDVDPSGKTPISFVGENSNAPITRAGFSDNTQIAMHIRSVNKKETTKIKETRILAKASADATMSSVSFSNIDGANTDYIRYWDDAYGRDAKLSIFAVAVPGTMSPTNGTENKSLVDLLSGDATWKENANLTETIKWAVSTDQSGATIIANEDLAYSNNIKENGTNSVYEWDFNAESPNYKSTTIGGEMQFQLKKSGDTDGPGKFNKGHLVFNHALSRITVNVFKGTSFGTGSFTFTSGNISIANVPISGTFDIENGSWDSNTIITSTITSMATTTNESGADFKYMAQILPGFVIDGTDDGVLSFTIENNRYNVTKAMMLKALNKGLSTTSTSITMEQGKNYVFNLTVDKKSVDVSATLEPWVDVTAANQNMNNSHITVSVYKNDDSNAKANTTFDIYRLNDPSNVINIGESTSTNWDGNYTDKATVTDGVWDKKWYYENNKSFYHFRSVNKNTEIKGNTDNTIDYFEIESGAQDTHDYCWGAPLKDGTTSPIAYEKDASAEKPGYAAVIRPAIGSTESAINLTEFHMMSNIKVVLATSTGDDKIDLTDSKVYITKYYPKGTVQMGNGLVSTSGSRSATEDPITVSSTAAASAEFKYAVVPQALANGTDAANYVSIIIETKDGNKYYVNNLSGINVDTNSSNLNQGATAIAFWYPNHSYTYTFTLTKKGIDGMTCTVEKWIDVEAANTDVTLE